MNGKARRVYTPHNWDGINLPELHLTFHESLPDHHTVKARTIPYTMQDSVSKELTRLRHYHLLDSQSPYASALVVAAKATSPFVRMCGDYRWINQYILIQHEWIPNVRRLFKSYKASNTILILTLRTPFIKSGSTNLPAKNYPSLHQMGSFDLSSFPKVWRLPVPSYNGI
jgi:hypothetical protein